jgi:coproporphyrinogen III oxidase
MTAAAALEDRKKRTQAAFEDLRDRICDEFEAIEREHTGQLSELAPGRFERQRHERPKVDGKDAGGGVISVMKGRVFEKVGVNVSTVNGRFTPEMAKTVPGAEQSPDFWASSISLVAHLQNPHVPAVHMNLRHLVTAEGWFGGGADLTPMFMEQSVEDARDFHASLKRACDAHGADYYERFKKWCDEYFFLPHRNEARGAGGIFFDRHNTGVWEKDFAFASAVGLAFLDIYPQIVRRRMSRSWTEKDRDHQLLRRGRYVEFNLLWDRGTQFGLRTGHNTDAILMSMPPVARWI